MQSRRALILRILGLGPLVLVASGASAEWLVTADGSRVEIEGPWQVQGRVVTFTLPNGTLGSMPLTAVDLEASESLARELEEAAARPAEPAPKPKAVMVITDADVGRAARNVEGEGDDGDSGTAETSPGLRVSGWRERVDLASNSVRITGNLQNPTENPATSIQLEVKLLDESGQLLESSNARLDRGFLNPGASVQFEADFQETLSYDDVQFDIQSRGFLANPPEEQPESDEEADDLDEESS